jgi:DNA-binding CsgD family transcriptional regulator/PAS domain-containing protein
VNEPDGWAEEAGLGSKIDAFERCPLATRSRFGEAANELFSGHLATKIGEPSDGTLTHLSNLLPNSTVGVALFDENLFCRGFNVALGKMVGVPAQKNIGKSLHRVFPGVATKMELAFRRVWATGISLSNLELTARLPNSPEPRCWVVNFYPISDDAGRMRLVAGTFSEVTKDRCVELRLGRLRGKFRSTIRRQPHLLEEEFSDVSARTFELVNRSVALLRNSVSVRFSMFETHLEAALVRHALFMSGNRSQNRMLSHTPPHSDSSADSPASQRPPDHTEPAAGGPSPRELQVLRFLADGKSSKEIGAVLDISSRTVESYRARIMIKLDLHSTAALVRYAIRNKIIEP